MTYFTSDLHIGHENIIRFSNRPFSTLDEMNRTLVDNWNSRVTERDDVFVLGDMFYRKKEGVEEILKKLKGRKHLIIGNHDYSWMKSIEPRKYFVETETLLVLKEEGRVMTLCHYPIMSWPHMYHGSYCIFGHIHNSANNADYWPLIESNPYLLNAGVDVNNFYPVTFEELKRNNEVFKEKARETKQEIIT